MWHRGSRSVIDNSSTHTHTHTHIHRHVFGTNDKANGSVHVEALVIFLLPRLCCGALSSLDNTLRPRQNGRHFTDGISKWIFLNENIWIPLKFVHKSPINNLPALAQIMAWRRPGAKPLSEPMMVNLPTHICVTRPQWVNSVGVGYDTSESRAVVMEIPSRNPNVAQSRFSWFSVFLFTEHNHQCHGYHKNSKWSGKSTGFYRWSGWDQDQ